MAEKKTWQAPSVEILGSMREKTQDNAKYAGTWDGDPFQDCPYGQYKMGTCGPDGGGGGGTS